MRAIAMHVGDGLEIKIQYGRNDWVCLLLQHHIIASMHALHGVSWTFYCISISYIASCMMWLIMLP